MNPDELIAQKPPTGVSGAVRRAIWKGLLRGGWGWMLLALVWAVLWTLLVVEFGRPAWVPDATGEVKGWGRTGLLGILWLAGPLALASLKGRSSNQQLLGRLPIHMVDVMVARLLFSLSFGALTWSVVGWRLLSGLPWRSQLAWGGVQTVMFFSVTCIVAAFHAGDQARGWIPWVGRSFFWTALVAIVAGTILLQSKVLPSGVGELAVWFLSIALAVWTWRVNVHVARLNAWGLMTEDSPRLMRMEAFGRWILVVVPMLFALVIPWVWAFVCAVTSFTGLVAILTTPAFQKGHRRQWIQAGFFLFWGLLLLFRGYDYFTGLDIRRGDFDDLMTAGQGAPALVIAATLFAIFSVVVIVGRIQKVTAEFVSKRQLLARLPILPSEVRRRRLSDLMRLLKWPVLGMCLADGLGIAYAHLLSVPLDYFWLVVVIRTFLIAGVLGLFLVPIPRVHRWLASA